MKKLELKHLAGYLPYGLKIMVHGDFKMEMSHKRIQDNFEDDLKYLSIDGVLEDFHCKPILHPLLDLTKEIEVNGEKFVPIDRILKERECDVEYDFIEALEDDLESAEDKIQFAPYSIIQKLFEWQFDIYGLIENNLAIDINTLK